MNENPKNIDLDNPEFQNAMKLINFTSQSVFLTGRAGTGKSTFLRHITANTKKKHVVLAPTGIAAVNVGGQTLHSFFKLPFKPLMPDDPEFANGRRLDARLKYSKVFIKMLRNLELIVIDEVSMVRADTIDFIDRVLRHYRHSRLPFGGIQLLLVGDIFQLEPVVTTETRDILRRRYRYPFFFNAEVFENLPLVAIELRKVYRQVDPDFVALLDRIRTGNPTDADIAMLNRRAVSADTDDIDTSKMVMTIATLRQNVDKINEEMLGKIKKKEYVFKGAIKGNFPENSLPTDKVLTLKEGAQVVFVKNSPDRTWVNGTIGRVIEVKKDKIFVQLEDGTKHDVEREIWENIRYEYDEEKKAVIEKVEGTYTQYPVKLAWALTIHKSQGLTFDNIKIDIGRGAFTGGQSYVALSRCTSLAGIRMASTINQRDVFVNPMIVSFSRTFNDAGVINDALERAKADSCYAAAAESFEKADYSAAVDMFCEAVCARNDLKKPEVVRLLKIKLARLSEKDAEIAELKAQLADCNKKFEKLAAEYVTLGEECREDGWNPEAALGNFNKALSLAPDYLPALLGKGKTLAEIGDVEQAVSTFTKALNCDSTDFRAPLELGCLFMSQSDYILAVDYLLMALQRNDKIARVHENLAECYNALEEHKLAQKHLGIAARLRRKKNK